jgi:hypothetical protein
MRNVQIISGLFPDRVGKAMLVAKSAANRWTENVMSLRSYCTATFGISSDDFDSQFEISADFDTVA